MFWLWRGGGPEGFLRACSFSKAWKGESPKAREATTMTSTSTTFWNGTVYISGSLDVTPQLGGFRALKGLWEHGVKETSDEGCRERP